MFGSRGVELLSLTEIEKVFGLDGEWLRQEVSEGRFVAAQTADSEACWNGFAVWSWLAYRDPAAAARADLRYWPACPEPQYVGVRFVPGAVVQDWRIAGVPLRVVWPVPPALQQVDMAAAAALQPPLPQVLQVGPDYGLTGPTLYVHGSDGERYAEEASWRDLAAVLGGKAPYWPFSLRVEDVMQRWRPGAEPVEVAAVPSMDVLPFLRLAAAVDEGTASHRVLLNLARLGQARETEEARLDVEIAVAEGRGERVALAAVPMPVVDPVEVSEAERRASWLDILSRTDSLAVAATREYLAWDGGTALPYSKFHAIDPTTPVGAEWAARLRPARRTAAYELVDLEPDQVLQYLVDPVTDAPVARLVTGELRAAIPQRIATTSPLAALVLEGPIWIRVEDGTVYMAPRGSRYGLEWGYDGTGPHTLALLLYRLLHEITAPGIERADTVPEGLVEFTRQDWPAGSTFSRRELEAARDGRPPRFGTANP